MPELPKIRDNDIQITRTLLSLLGYRTTKVREGGPKKAAGRIIGSARMGVATKDKQIQYLQLMGYRVEGEMNPRFKSYQRMGSPTVTNRQELQAYPLSDFSFVYPEGESDRVKADGKPLDRVRKLNGIPEPYLDGQYPPSAN